MKPIPTINVNPKPCDAPRRPGYACPHEYCAAKPLPIPRPIPPSVTFTVRLGECTAGCLAPGAARALKERGETHYAHCPARPIRVSCSVSGDGTWAGSEISMADLDVPGPRSADELRTAYAACRVPWEIVKALVTGGDWDEKRATLSLFRQRDAVFAALADMARAEEAAVAAQQVLFPFKLRTPDAGHWPRPEDRPSAAFLAAYVERLIEQVGILGVAS